MTVILLGAVCLFYWFLRIPTRQFPIVHPDLTNNSTRTLAVACPKLEEDARSSSLSIDGELSESYQLTGANSKSRRLSRLLIRGVANAQVHMSVWLLLVYLEVRRDGLIDKRGLVDPDVYLRYTAGLYRAIS
jgi:hypothetical protein